MNERIGQLAEQAGLLGPTSRVGNSHQATEKFAELLIKECIKFCEHEFNDDEYDEHDTGMWIKAQSIKTAIMEHFGVEE